MNGCSIALRHEPVLESLLMWDAYGLSRLPRGQSLCLSPRLAWSCACRHREVGCAGRRGGDIRALASCSTRRSRKWKLASATALASAALGLLVNQLVAQFWHRARPFAAHRSAHVWGGRSHDPSFPSDHASAAFAIGFAVLLFDRVAGALFLAAAVVIGVGRVLIGAHYPADVLAGVLVGLACAVVVARLARPAIEFVVRIVERLTDPLLAPLWRLRRTPLSR
jgi:membrane-associated phospholipid phosphatase